MPGPNVSSWLEQQDYVTFYDLFHTYSEFVMLPMHAIRATAALFRRVSAPGTQSEQMAGIYRVAVEFDTFFQDKPERVHRFFLPQDTCDIPDRKVRDALYQERWHPYDEQVWDTLVSDLGDLISPWLPTVESYHQQLKELVEAATLQPSKVLPNPHIVLPGLLDLLIQNHDRLRSYLDQDALDGLFTNRADAHRRG